jgi:hypothetical protein
MKLVRDVEGECAGEAAENEGELEEAEEALQGVPAFFEGPEPFAEAGEGPGDEAEDSKGEEGIPSSGRACGDVMHGAYECNSGQKSDGAPRGEKGADKAEAQADEACECGGLGDEHGMLWEGWAG